jgi:hypothetical protein
MRAAKSSTVKHNRREESNPSCPLLIFCCCRDGSAQKDFEFDYKTKTETLASCSMFAGLDAMRIRRLSLDFRLHRCGAKRGT